MVSQTVLPFKLETTQDTITAPAGLIVFGEYLQAMGWPSQLDRALPGPLNPVGDQPSAYGVSRVLLRQGGGRSLEDWRMPSADEGWRTRLNLTALPRSDATGGWVRARDWAA